MKARTTLARSPSFQSWTASIAHASPFFHLICMQMRRLMQMARQSGGRGGGGCLELCAAPLRFQSVIHDAGPCAPDPPDPDAPLQQVLRHSPPHAAGDRHHGLYQPAHRWHKRRRIPGHLLLLRSAAELLLTFCSET